MIERRIRILCVSDYFLPGYLGGGPIRTLANMRAILGTNIELAIFTRDRDLGGGAPYADITPDCWHDTSGGPIFYASPRLFGPRGARQAMAGQRFDALYLNSFFSYRGSIALYLALRGRGLPVLIAPRGEFSPGALAIKRAKKQLFLKLARALRLYRGVHWHASTEAEAADIRRQFPGARIYLAADPVVGEENALPPPDKRPGELRLAFISRLSPKKNLDGLLDILMGSAARIELSIFGPIEDADYWALCEAKIARLPANVRAHYGGTLRPEQVSATFAQHDLFAFPTHGENFGHVIFEALRAGTPVLLSDQTPWAADAAGAISIAPLAEARLWQQEIARAAARDTAAQNAVRKAARAFARHYAAGRQSVADNLRMFEAVAQSANF